MKLTRKSALATFAAPLALALSGCGDEAAETGAVDGEPIADIAAPEGQSWTDVVQVTEDGGYLLGNPDAPLKLVEYGSLTCGACANFTQTGAEPLKSEYVSSGVVSYELHTLARDAFDLTLARLVRCGAPENFHPLADQVWMNFDTVMDGASQGAQQLQAADIPENQRFLAIADAAGFLDFFAARGISREQAVSCLGDTDAVTSLGQQLTTQADAAGVNSTPTFILNGRTLDERSWNQLEGVLQRAGARDE